MAFLLMTEQTQRSLSLIFIAFASSTLIYLFLGFLLGQTTATPRPMAEHQQMLFILFLFLSLVQLVLVWFFRKTTYSASFHPENIQALEDHLRSKHIVLFALSEVPAIYGLIYFFLTGHFAGQILLTIFSLICLAVSKPSVPAIEALERKLGF